MTTQALPLDRVIRITSTITATQPLRADFGRTLLVTTDDALRPPSSRTKVYSGIAGVAADFATTSNAYLDAQKYFGISPYPKNLVMGRWATSGAGARLQGGAPGSLVQLQTVTAGALGVGGLALTGLDFSALTSFAGVATAVETALNAASVAVGVWAVATNYTVGTVAEGSDGNFYTALVTQTGNDPTTDDGTNWRLEGPNLDSANIDHVDGMFQLNASSTTALQAFAVSTAQNVDTLMGWTSASGAVNIAGYAADTDIAAGVAAINASNSSWYWACTDGGITQDADLEAFAAAIQAMGRVQAGIDTVGSAPLVTNEITSLAARLSNREYNRVFATWKATREPLALAAAARMSSVNFNGTNTLVNPNGRNLPGITADRLGGNIAGADELERKRINYYAVIGARARFIAGWTLDPSTWMDSRYFLDWLVETIQLDLDNYLTGAPTRTPQTPLGQAGMIATAEASCRKGVRNGGLAPGFVDEALAGDIRTATGNIDFDGYLSQGYLVWAPPFSTLSAAEIRARQAPSLRVWLRGSGAINTISGELIFQG